MAISEKVFPNGTKTSYDYYPGGLLKSLVSSDSKGILDKYEYTYNEKGNRTAVTNLIQPFAFTGYREQENGLYYAQARSYDSLSGRFTSVDKVQGIVIMPETVNHYIYCFNDPTVYVDQNGLCPKILSDIGQGLKTQQQV